MPENDFGAEQGLFAAPEDRAAFDRFTRRLVGLARTHLDARLQHKIEPEDVVQSVYRSFFLRYGEQLPENQDLEGLWPLLTLITVRKCADRVRYYQAERRKISREASAGAANDDRPLPWQEAVSREPTPEHAAVLAETLENLLTHLDADERPIIELSLQGFSTQEISERLGRAERSVRRLRERVRKQLERQ
jgi:RNA polymerase sigma-70 factor (ECF subfamily)